MSDEKQDKKSPLTFLGKKPILFVLLLLGGLLIFFGSGMLDSAPVSTGDYDAAAAKEAIQREACRLVASASGDAGAVVVLHFDGNERYVYAANESASGGYSYLYSGGKGLLLTVEAPPVSGIAVLCRGGGSVTLREELTGLLSSLYGVGYDRIRIAERKP